MATTTDQKAALPRVLFVDDEPFVLDAIRRNTRKIFDATFVEGGQGALDLLHGNGNPFEVLCTDMRMPGVDGLAVLKAFREHAPDTTRVLLTGQADLESAVAAVNEGSVFRFLLKPTSPDQLKVAIDDAYELRRLRLAERELLEQTLRGSIDALTDILSLANPAAFARARRVRNLMDHLLDQVDVPNRWEIEVAVMLSQVGAVTLPPQVSDRQTRGVPLDREELSMIDELPVVADKLLAKIPRLEVVREIIAAQRYWNQNDVPLATKLLALASEYDTLHARRLAPDVIVSLLEERADEYGPVAMQALKAMLSAAPEEGRIVQVAPKDLRIGMVLAGNVRTRDGVLLVGKGSVVTEGSLARIHNFARTTGLEESTVPVLQKS